MPNYRFILREIEKGDENEIEFTKRLKKAPTLAEARQLALPHLPKGEDPKQFDLTVIPAVLMRAAYEDLEFEEFERIQRKYGDVFSPIDAALYYCEDLSK